MALIITPWSWQANHVQRYTLLMYGMCAWCIHLKSHSFQRLVIWMVIKVMNSLAGNCNKFHGTWQLTITCPCSHSSAVGTSGLHINWCVFTYNSYIPSINMYRMPFSTASSIPLCYILFPANVAHVSVGKRYRKSVAYPGILIGGGGFNKFSWEQRAERMGIWGQ
jgi:hypothetical protein